jgi:hypothetical protein
VQFLFQALSSIVAGLSCSRGGSEHFTQQRERDMNLTDFRWRNARAPKFDTNLTQDIADQTIGKSNKIPFNVGRILEVNHEAHPNSAAELYND